MSAVRLHTTLSVMLCDSGALYIPVSSMMQILIDIFSTKHETCSSNNSSNVSMSESGGPDD